MSNTDKAMESDAIELLRDLVKALEGAFISSWQSTHAWKKELNASREWLDAMESKQLTRSEA